MQFIAYVVRAKESNSVVYCGITTRSLHKRWTAHRKSKFALGCAIRKYGEDAFSIEEIARSWSFDDLKEFEKLLIEQYGTYAPGGYNLTRGGDGVLGIKFSEETLAQMSLSRKGIRWTEEQKAVLRAAKSNKPPPFLGKRHTEETKALIKARLPLRQGEHNAFYGKKHTPETLERISGENNHGYGKKFSAERVAAMTGENNHRFGKKLSPETLLKMSEKQAGKNNPNFGKPWTEERRARQMATFAARAAKNGAQSAVL